MPLKCKVTLKNFTSLLILYIVYLLSPIQSVFQWLLNLTHKLNSTRLVEGF